MVRIINLKTKNSHGGKGLGRNAIRISIVQDKNEEKEKIIKWRINYQLQKREQIKMQFLMRDIEGR